jgi:hypothetical protein
METRGRPEAFWPSISQVTANFRGYAILQSGEVQRA